MGKITKLFLDAQSKDETIKQNAILKIQQLGYDYSLPGLIMQSIKEKNPFSLVRLGDGELAILTQLYHSAEEVNNNYAWTRDTGYCGVSVPCPGFLKRMIDGIKNATVVGMFENDPLNKKVFEAMNYYPEHRCHAFENLYLPMRKDFVKIIREYPPLLIGRRSKEYAKHFRDLFQIEVPGAIEINSFKEIDDVINKSMDISHKWEWALVCAGASAVVIAAEFDYKYGKIALDYGHAEDNILAEWHGYWYAVD